mmetsp:Transcript_20400/g.33780  ORF Transcript_20400/g.33780 Transcript_20400/m.33780 type:complete len:98 (-) Transcript_20400:65-358(-)
MGSDWFVFQKLSERGATAINEASQYFLLCRRTHGVIECVPGVAQCDDLLSRVGVNRNSERRTLRDYYDAYPTGDNHPHHDERRSLSILRRLLIRCRQ